MTLLDAQKSLRAAQRVVAVTGAGISAESGVPTFRDAQTGLWSKFRPQDLATETAFRKNPDMVWSWYQWRRELVSNCQPNTSHYALAQAEDYFESFILITQNVDGLHAAAGSRNVLEFHGNLFNNLCIDARHPYQQSVIHDKTPPRCPRCDSLVRPGVVWFGEALDDHVLTISSKASAECDVLLSIGTSSEVYPAADLAMRALRQGATVIEVNLETTPLSPLATHCLVGSTSTILPQLFEP